MDKEKLELQHKLDELGHTLYHLIDCHYEGQTKLCPDCLKMVKAAYRLTPWGDKGNDKPGTT